MNWYRLAGFVLLVLGAGLIGYSVMAGEGNVGIFVIFPYYMGTGIIGLISILAIMAGIFLLFFSFVPVDIDEGRWENMEERGEQPLPRPGRYQDKKEMTRERGGRNKVRGGGVILIGPIPIVWGSDSESVKWVVVATIILMVIAVLFFLFMW